jgi:hypothetical protein
MKKIILLASTLALAGCNVTTGITNTNAWFNKYGPIIGKDLIMVANILVTAECSPALAPTSQVATNILTITAPNSGSASKVKNVLATNVEVAQQLCPLVSAIKAQVGNVPNGTPSQVVPASGA